MLLLWWSAGALLAYEEHLNITVGFSLKTNSDSFYQTDSDGPYHADTQQLGCLPSQPFYKKY